MIDLDYMDAQLADALTEPVRGPQVGVRRPHTVIDLLEQGRLADADAAIAATTDRREALTWTIMRSLLAGRPDDVRAGIAELEALGRVAGGEAGDPAWTQRYWAAFEWGGHEDRYDALDHCRERAYRFDDLQWWGNLVLLGATMGKADEAIRAFDTTMTLVVSAADAAARLDALTNLVEAAFLLGDAGRTAAAARHLPDEGSGLVFVGANVVCKGSVERYRALGHAAAGRRAEASACFAKAEAIHRTIGAGPLLARTSQQASAA